jgi:hypothetical protein
VIPRPLAWGIALVLTGLEALNVIAAVFVDGYVSDGLVHATFATIVGFMLGIREGSNVVSRTLTAFRNISSPPPVPPGTPSAPPPQTPVDPQEPRS